MAKFPDNSTIGMLEPLSESIEFRTGVSPFEEGEEKRRQKWLYPKRHPVIRYQSISKTNARTVWQFFLDRKGAYEGFNFFNPLTNTYLREYVGTGDGSQTVWNLPSKGAASYTLYLGVLPQTPTTDYTFSSGGGEDGCDKVTMVVAPNAGDVLTWDFTGYLKVRCRFAEDILDFETFYDRLINMGIKTKGLLNE